MEAICECKQDAPNGPAVFFYENKGPDTYYQTGQRGFDAAPTPMMFPMAPTSAPTILRPSTSASKKKGHVPKTPSPRTPTPTADNPWGGVAVRLYAEYHNGKWSGRVAAWDEEGTQTFFGEYKQHKLDGVCCLIKDGELSTVAECAHGEFQAVHRIAGAKIQASFDDPKQAGELIRGINAAE